MSDKQADGTVKPFDALLRRGGTGFKMRLALTFQDGVHVGGAIRSAICLRVCTAHRPTLSSRSSILSRVKQRGPRASMAPRREWRIAALAGPSDIDAA